MDQVFYETPYNNEVVNVRFYQQQVQASEDDIPNSKWF